MPRDSRLEADAVNRGLVGQGVGAQAFALRDKILEVDAWLRTRPTVTVLEVHPEVSFAAMAGAPILASKKTDEGRDRAARRPRCRGHPAAVRARGPGVCRRRRHRRLRGRMVGRAPHLGLARPLPDPPERFSDGIAAAISRPRYAAATAYLDPAGRAGARPPTLSRTALRRAPAVASQPGWVGWTNSATSRPGVPTGTSHAAELSATTCGSRPWTRPPQAALTVSTKWYCVVTGLGVELGDAARLEVVTEALEVVQGPARVVDGRGLGDAVALGVDEERIAEQVDLRVAARPGVDGAQGVLGALDHLGRLGRGRLERPAQLDGSRRVRQLTTIVEKPMSLPPMVRRTRSVSGVTASICGRATSWHDTVPV